MTPFMTYLGNIGQLPMLPLSAKDRKTLRKRKAFLANSSQRINQPLSCSVLGFRRLSENEAAEDE